MPTRNISLTAEQNAFVEKIVKSGEHQNASEAIRDAPRALQQRRREDAVKLKALRTQIKAGVEVLEGGDRRVVEQIVLDGLEDCALSRGYNVGGPVDDDDADAEMS